MSDERQKQIIQKIVTSTNDEEKEALSKWASRLLEIKNSDMSNIAKGKNAISATTQSKLIIPIIKVLANELNLNQIDVSKIRMSSYKDVLKSIDGFWKRRSLPMKLTVGASTVAAIVFGSQGAGIAALGGAIGVPLWVIFGAGGTFVGVLYEEITGKKSSVETSYRIIEAKEKPKTSLVKKLKNFKLKKE